MAAVGRNARTSSGKKASLFSAVCATTDLAITKPRSAHFRSSMEPGISARHTCDPTKYASVNRNLSSEELSSPAICG